LAEDLGRRRQVVEDALLQGYLASIPTRVEAQVQSRFSCTLKSSLVRSRPPKLSPLRADTLPALKEQKPPTLRRP
jgi:hypothetical protein